MIKEEKCSHCGKIFWSGGVVPQHVCSECQMSLPEVYNYSWGVDMAKEGTEIKRRHVRENNAKRSCIIV
jgi:hypothetical protein